MNIYGLMIQVEAGTSTTVEHTPRGGQSPTGEISHKTRLPESPRSEENNAHMTVTFSARTLRAPQDSP